jgi:hypothetical protein
MWFTVLMRWAVCVCVSAYGCVYTQPLCVWRHAQALAWHTVISLCLCCLGCVSAVIVRECKGTFT